MEGVNVGVVLVPLPYEGHLNPMLQLGSILHSKGFSVTVVHTHFSSPNPSHYPQFEFVSIPDGLSDSEAASGDFMAVMASINNNCGTDLYETLVRVMGSRDGEIGCVIYDSLMYLTEAVARRLRLRSMVLRTCSVSHVMTYHVYPFMRERGDIPIQESKLTEIVPGMNPIRYKDLPIHKFYNVEAYLEFVTKVANISSSSPSIWNTVECLEQPALAKAKQQYQVPIFPIGPLHKLAKPSPSSLIQEDTNCITWLDKHPESSVLYVSLGSVATVGKKELAEMAWGLANSKQPFLWVIRPRSVAGSEWIELLPAGYMDAVGERCCIVKWAPQKKVLEHNAVGGFWSHCGWNSTIESIAEGVPLICMPCFGDQRVNARYLSQVWRIGLPLENDFERGEIEIAVRSLMVDEEGKIMRQRAADLKKEIQISTMEGGCLIIQCANWWSTSNYQYKLIALLQIQFSGKSVIRFISPSHT